MALYFQRPSIDNSETIVDEKHEFLNASLRNIKKDRNMRVKHTSKEIIILMKK